MSEKILTIRMSDELHKAAKIYAAKREISIAAYIKWLLTEDLKNNGEYYG